MAAPIVCPDGQILTDFGCTPDNPVGFVEKFYGIGLGLIGFVALIFLIIGGYYLMTSQGDPVRLGKAKSYIIYSIAGVILAIFGFVFVQFIAGSVLQIPGFNS
jgi:hypothetical protein